MPPGPLFGGTPAFAVPYGLGFRLVERWQFNLVQVIKASSGELPNAYPVDEHGCREDTTLGRIAAAGPTDCQGEHGRKPIAGVVERPPQVAGIAVDWDGLRRYEKYGFAPST